MSPRRALALAVPTLLLAVAFGCGGSNSDRDTADAPADATAPQTQPTAAGPPGSIADLLAESPAEDSALIFGTSDYAVGSNRLVFLLVNSKGELVLGDRARVKVARGGFDGVPEQEAMAQNLPVGAPEDGVARDGDFDAPAIWVAELEFDAPGQYTILVEPTASSLQGFAQIEVAAEPAAPAVGDKAFPSDNPTLEDDFAEKITTARPPDVELLEYSIKQSLADRAPFVVTFATPQFCESRVCGPVVDIVDSVRRTYADTPVRFIHIEVFEGNDPQRGVNQWMKEWNLPTEPYTFLVDASGIIRARFEGLVTAGELEQAVQEFLL